MKFKNKSIPFWWMLVLSTLGCKKFVEVPPPVTQLVTASVFNNNATATSAVTEIYTQMFNNTESYLISQSNGLLSDELTNYATVSPQKQYYENAMTAVNLNGTAGEWSNAYNYIYRANAVIEALKNNRALSPSVVSQLKGEAEFIRAFWLFYLTNCYGDVPLVTTTNYAVNGLIARSPKGEVFQQIIADLNDAKSLLNGNYVDASDTTITLQRVRPTKWAAAALLARAYLYKGDFSNATSQATSVINNSALYSLGALNQVFLTNSTEAIWQIGSPLPISSSVITWDGYFYILLAAPGTDNFGSSTLSSQLLNSFEAGDKRRTNWVDSISFPGQTYYFPYKYKVSSSNNVTEYTMVLRLAEQYLIRAEAEAQMNDLGNAAKDLNVIRNRAGLPNTTASTQSGLLTAILHERQVEFFTEWGARWFDLIRTGNINNVMGSPGNVTAMKGGTWVPTDSLYPIPQSERAADPNLTQNPGY